MYKRVFWSLAIVIACLWGTGRMNPAWAWGGGGPTGQGHAGAWGGHQNARQCQSRYGQWSCEHGQWAHGRSRYGQSQYGMSNGVWPAGPYIGSTEATVPDNAPVPLQVIVLTKPPQAGGAPAPAAMDFGYVPGCRAIPNGYHCDPPRREGQAN